MSSSFDFRRDAALEESYQGLGTDKTAVRVYRSDGRNVRISVIQLHGKWTAMNGSFDELAEKLEPYSKVGNGPKVMNQLSLN